METRQDRGCGKGKVGSGGKCVRAKNILKAAAIAAPIVGGAMVLHGQRKYEQRMEEKRKAFRDEQQAIQENYQKQKDELHQQSRAQEQQWAEEDRQEKIREEEIISKLKESRQPKKESRKSELKQPPRTPEQEEELRQADERRERQLERWERKNNQKSSQRKNRRRGGRRSRPVTDSLIATAIAVRQHLDGCPAGTRGEKGRGCIRTKGKRLKQYAGKAFGALDRSADLIQKAATTATAIGVLNNWRKTTGKKPDAAPKEDSIATAIAAPQKKIRMQERIQRQKGGGLC